MTDEIKAETTEVSVKDDAGRLAPAGYVNYMDAGALNKLYKNAAVFALGEEPEIWDNEYELGRKHQWEADVLALEAVSPAEPERKKGKWIWKTRQLNSNYHVEGIAENGDKEKVYVHRGGKVAFNYCSECGKRGDDTFLNFCPNCGADMRGAGDD